MPEKFDPEKAENFEDVCSPAPLTIRTSILTLTSDGEAVRGSRLVAYFLPFDYQFILAFNPTTNPISPAVEHLMTYWSILEKVKGSQLRLTKMDDEIYEDFKANFPEFDPAATIDEDAMKSKAGKEKWRNWMNQYEKKINDYNFGTIIRSNPKFEYDKDTTIFGTFWCPFWLLFGFPFGDRADEGYRVADAVLCS